MTSSLKLVLPSCNVLNKVHSIQFTKSPKIGTESDRLLLRNKEGGVRIEGEAMGNGQNGQRRIEQTKKREATNKCRSEGYKTMGQVSQLVVA